MKNLINKLFEWLGYVPKSKYEVLSQEDFLKQLDPCEHAVLVNELRKPIPLSVALEKSLDEQITLNNKVTQNEEYDFLKRCVKDEITEFAYHYYIISSGYRFSICLAGVRPDMPYFPIKIFETNDLEYGKLCAEELCEMLNQKM